MLTAAAPVGAGGTSAAVTDGGDKGRHTARKYPPISRQPQSLDMAFRATPNRHFCRSAVPTAFGMSARAGAIRRWNGRAEGGPSPAAC